jgi:hypothetical protein
MLKLNKREIEILYEALKTLYAKNQDSKEISELVDKFLRTGKIDTSKKANESLNEEHQLLDKVYHDKQRGDIIGEFEGKFIVMVQGNTYMVDPKDIKEYKKKPDVLVQPHMKFDEKTQKLLFEKYVKCGVYLGNVPIKMNDCYVKYSQWENAKDEQQIKVLVEGNATFMPKSQVRIYENPNDFANPDNYVPGVIINEETEEPYENILLNAIDFVRAIGEADGVEIIKTLEDGSQEIQSMPKSSIRALAL